MKLIQALSRANLATGYVARHEGYGEGEYILSAKPDLGGTLYYALSLPTTTPQGEPTRKVLHTQHLERTLVVIDNVPGLLTGDGWEVERFGGEE